MNRFKDLETWKDAVDIAVSIYSITEHFPLKEKHGLISQLNRAAVSISSNIAEGAGRVSRKEFSHFLSIANGSACEADSLIVVAERLKMIDAEKSQELQADLQKVQNKIAALKRSVDAQLRQATTLKQNLLSK